jgi:hypothetical protein
MSELRFFNPHDEIRQTENRPIGGRGASAIA